MLHGRTVALLTALAAVALAGVGAGTACAAASLSPVRHVTVGDIDVGYRTGPDGGRPPLLLITGRSAAMADWDPRMLAPLMRSFHLVVFDNRAVATTSAGTKPITIEQMAQDAAGLIDALRLGRPHVLAWSMGGYVAQQLAVDRPGLVRTLVLDATNPGGTHYRQPGPFVRNVLGSDVSSDTLFALSFPPTGAGLRGAAAYLRAIATQGGVTPADFEVSAYAQAGQQSATSAWKSASGGLWNQIHRLRQRVLVADGALDVIDRGANGRRLARRIPRARHCVFAGAGHAFLFQDAQLYGATARLFLLGAPLRAWARAHSRLRCRLR